MPASSFELYYMQDARNNFDAMRPVPVCADANQPVGQCQQKIHISTNCYYGYHSSNNQSGQTVDCEMSEAPPGVGPQLSHSHSTNTRKRGAEEDANPLTKRLRDEEQRKREIVPETSESLELCKSPQELLENLFWNTHGGNIYHSLQCL